MVTVSMLLTAKQTLPATLLIEFPAKIRLIETTTKKRMAHQHELSNDFRTQIRVLTTKTNVEICLEKKTHTHNEQYSICQAHMVPNCFGLHFHKHIYFNSETLNSALHNVLQIRFRLCNEIREHKNY